MLITQSSTPSLTEAIVNFTCISIRCVHTRPHAVFAPSNPPSSSPGADQTNLAFAILPSEVIICYNKQKFDRLVTPKNYEKPVCIRFISRKFTLVSICIFTVLIFIMLFFLSLKLCISHSLSCYHLCSISCRHVFLPIYKSPDVTPTCSALVLMMRQGHNVPLINWLCRSSVSLSPSQWGTMVCCWSLSHFVLWCVFILTYVIYVWL